MSVLKKYDSRVQADLVQQRVIVDVVRRGGVHSRTILRAGT